MCLLMILPKKDGGHDKIRKKMYFAEQKAEDKSSRLNFPSWIQIALIMRNKPDIGQVDIDDLYNNVRVYEDEMKSTNEVSPTSGNFGVNTVGGTSSSNQVSSTPSTDEVVCSFFANQATNPPLDNEDLQQID
ncbi:hypothetical protein Tco_1275707 [Tanacetum coccineum]